MYGRLLDAADYDGVGELFADGTLLDPEGREIARGRDDVRDFYRRTVILRDGSPRTEHATTEIEISLEGDRASARSRFLTHMEGVQVAAGRYEDTFMRDGDIWRFTTRRFFLDDARGLSTHVRLPQSKAT